ncbi:hypothetical protein [Streptomyces sp. NBC_00572]|uniref:hypothetical protein n=1 Tax=Streptomyces sp. NBC_00572 TaxID=2903664 RepID=UPI00225A9C2E|nr:hypothetical protein [Streptomyces sp. NBC_00572]MCX4984573.1 hypothetical protein [Streptomyces sp. NBC_00572]
MRAIRAASVVLLSAAAVVTVAPFALAGDENHNITSFGFSVTPETVAPGGTVTLKSDGCEVPSVTVTSGVFDTVTLTEGRSGSATVDVDAKAGAQYEIAFDCKGERGTTTLTVAQGNTGGNTTGHNESMPPGAHKGVKAGYGTAAAARADTDGLGVTEVVTGVLLIVGALGAAVVLARRRDAAGRV